MLQISELPPMHMICHPIRFSLVIARGDIKQVSEVGYVFQERLEGKSKVTWKQYIDYLRHLIRLRLTINRASRPPASSSTIIKLLGRSQNKYSYMFKMLKKLFPRRNTNERSGIYRR